MNIAKLSAVIFGAILFSAAHATDFGPTENFLGLPNPVYPGAVKTGFPTPTSGEIRVQSGTSASPLANGQYAIESQAIVNAPWPYESASLWSPHEFSVINKGHGRAHGLNAALITETDVDIDNATIFSYGKSKYTSGQSDGAVVGLWNVVDVQNTLTRSIGAEFVTMPGAVDYFDPNPKGPLTHIPADYATQGAGSFGVRVSNLVGSTIIPRALDVIAENPSAGFDTGINIQAYRSRAIYVHNNMAANRGGARTALEASETVPSLLKWTFTDGTPFSLEQNWSQTFNASYATFRKDASFNWWSMHTNGTMTFSTDSQYGARLVIHRDPGNDGIVKANHATNSAFMVKNSGRYYLSEDKLTWIDYVGGNVRIVKNGNVVAQF